MSLFSLEHNGSTLSSLGGLSDIDMPNLYNNSTAKPALYLAIFWSSIKQPEKQTKTYRIAIDIILSVIGIVCNIFVLIAILSISALRSMKTNIFILSLTMADLLVSTCVLTVTVGFGHYTGLLVQDDKSFLPCRIWASLIVVACTASSLNIMAIAVDRYIFLADPLHYSQRLTSERLIISLSVVWFMGVLVAVPPFFSEYGLAGMNSGQKQVNIIFHPKTINIPPAQPEYCGLTPTRQYTIFVVVIAIIIPGICVIGIYTKILYLVLSQYKRMREQAILGTYKDSVHHVSVEEEESSSVADNGDTPEKTETKQEFSEFAFTSPSYRSTGSNPSQDNLRAKSSPSQPGLGSNVDPKQPDKKSVTPEKPAPISHSSIVLCVSKKTQKSVTRPETKRRSFSLTVDWKSVFFPHYNLHEIKAVLVLSLIVGTYLICWLPFALLSLWLAIYPGSTSPIAREITLWLAYSNSCWDPLLYALLSKYFRHAIIAQVRKILRKRQSLNINTYPIRTGRPSTYEPDESTDLPTSYVYT